MEIQVKQLDGGKFSVESRSHAVICDQPYENGGKDAGMTRPEFLLASLGTCAAYYAAEYLRTRMLANDGVQVSVTAEKLKGPAHLDNFRIRVESPVCLTNDQRDAMMRSVEHCLIKNTLLNPPKIEVELEIPCPAGAGI
jgi:putative redox protein